MGQQAREARETRRDPHAQGLGNLNALKQITPGRCACPWVGRAMVICCLLGALITTWSLLVLLQTQLMSFARPRPCVMQVCPYRQHFKHSKHACALLASPHAPASSRALLSNSSSRLRTSNLCPQPQPYQAAHACMCRLLHSLLHPSCHSSVTPRRTRAAGTAASRALLSSEHSAKLMRHSDLWPLPQPSQPADA